MGFSQILSFLLILGKIISFLVVTVIVRNSKSLNKDISWIIFILIFPFIGTFLYLFFGSDVIQSKLLTEISKSMENSKKYFVQDEEIIEDVVKKNNYTMLYLSNYCNFPITKRNYVEYYETGEVFFDRVKEELKGAKNFIFIEFFSIASGILWNEILDILMEKVKEGVEVRIIYDNTVSSKKIPSKYYKQLIALGIQCEPYYKKYPLWSAIHNHREHRKCVIVDGRIAFTGGVNIEDRYVNLERLYGNWKDVGISAYGESVWNFTVMFLSMWNGIRKKEEDFYLYKGDSILWNEGNDFNYVISFGDSPLDQENVGKNVYISMIHQAKRSISIFTPYLILDMDIHNALAMAAKRGVDVKVVIPGIPDKKLVYQVSLLNGRKLLRDKVKVYTYTPGFLHGKVILVDDEMAVVGTINMDYRSLYLDFEYGVFVENMDVIRTIKKDVEDTLQKSVMLDRKKVHFFRVLWEGFLQLFVPFM